MKHLSRASVFLVVLLTLVVSVSVRAQGPLSGSTTVQANLRAGPDRAEKILFSLPPGTDLVIEARNAAADWLLVQAPDARRGWILTRQVEFKVKPDLNSLPVSDTIISQQSAANVPTAPPTTAGTPDAANVESSPALDKFLKNPSSYAARITPGVRASIRAIYQKGLSLGNNPRVFAKVGDCWSSEFWSYPQFGSGGYNLGNFGYLNAVINYYSVSPRKDVANSFVNKSQSAHAGMHVGAVFDPIWADPKVCKPNETPLACEYRVNRPSVAIIMEGVTDIVFFSVGEYESLVQRVVSESLEQGIIPILSTAPNTPGPFHNKRIQFNDIVRSMAAANNLPLIELEGATDNLPDHGVDPDGVHPTPYYRMTRLAFTPERFRQGAVLWDFLALQSLYNVWREIA